MSEILFTPTGSEAEDRQIRRLHEEGKIERLTHGLYIRSDGEPVEAAIQREWARIVGLLVEGGVVTDRTAMEGLPSKTPDGDKMIAYVSADRSRAVLSLPGLEINIRSGSGPQPGDIPYRGTYLASVARKMLENLSPSRARNGIARTSGPEEVERALDRICQHNGGEALNKIRDDARELSRTMGLAKEFQQLDGIIGALLRTKSTKLSSKPASMRAKGSPIDNDCIDRLAILASYMQERAPETIKTADTTPARNRSGSFIEAYFSNYIEGTEFLVDDAVEIVTEGRLPENRPKDGHDVQSTYNLIVEKPKIAPSGMSQEDFVDAVRSMHKVLMDARPEVNPGVFKTRPNKAGDTSFVHPDNVQGTLREGFAMLPALQSGFHRALFLHYLVSEVHPFADGNGRVSRIFMGRELSAAGLSRIVVPTVYRNDYLDSLRALTRRNDPSIFVRQMEFLQKVAAACSAETISEAVTLWASAYAFCSDPRNARLEMPNPNLEIVRSEGVPAPADYWRAVAGPQRSLILSS